MNEPGLAPAETTAFYVQVWLVVRQIPPGKVAPYGQIAAYLPKPASIAPKDFASFRARWVGQAMAECPPGVPWQRVINAQGKISPRRGAITQRRLLTAEGVKFDENDKIDLKIYGWSGPDEEWLRSHGLVLP